MVRDFDKTITGFILIHNERIPGTLTISAGTIRLTLEFPNSKESLRSTSISLNYPLPRDTTITFYSSLYPNTFLLFHATNQRTTTAFPDGNQEVTSFFRYAIQSPSRFLINKSKPEILINSLLGNYSKYSSWFSADQVSIEQHGTNHHITRMDAKLVLTDKPVTSIQITNSLYPRIYILHQPNVKVSELDGATVETETYISTYTQSSLPIARHMRLQQDFGKLLQIAYNQEISPQNMQLHKKTVHICPPRLESRTIQTSSVLMPQHKFKVQKVARCLYIQTLAHRV